MKALIWGCYEIYANGVLVGKGDTNAWVQLRSPEDFDQAMSTLRKNSLNAAKQENPRVASIGFVNLSVTPWIEWRP